MTIPLYIMNANTQGEMKIRVIIDTEENNEKFRVISRPHNTIVDAFAEVAPVVEQQRQIIQSRNYQRFR